MQGWSTTSHLLSNVPPQGPLRRFLGQVCGQTYSMWPRTQLPQASQPKRGRLRANSARSVAWARDGWRSIQRKRDARKERSLLGPEESLTGKSLPRVSRIDGTMRSGAEAGEKAVEDEGAACRASTADEAGS